MLLTKMDLLNYQYLDKMNNNIGILCYEGKVEGLCCLWVLPTVVFKWPFPLRWVQVSDVMFKFSLKLVMLT